MGITFLSRIKPVAKSSLFAHRPSALPRVFFCDLLRLPRSDRPLLVVFDPLICARNRSCKISRGILSTAIQWEKSLTARIS